MGASGLTPVLALRDGALACEGVRLDAIAEAVGTPAFVYSTAAVRNQFDLLDHALAGVPHRIHYSLKANANWSLLRLIRKLGGGADVVSGGNCTVPSRRDSPRRTWCSAALARRCASSQRRSMPACGW
jgi:diaminopimelate decarboxylase